MVRSRLQAIAVTGAISALLSQPIGWQPTSLNRTSKELSINLNFNSPVLAQLPPKQEAGINYTPPNRGAPSSTASGGSRNHEGPTILQSDEDSLFRTRGTEIAPPVRGSETPAPSSSPSQNQSLPEECSQNLPVFLVPQDHAGETTSARPTFFWYMPNTGSVDFALKKVGEEKPLFQERLKVPKVGIIQVKMPEEGGELTVGQDYLWSVSVVCNTRAGARTVTVQARVRRVAPTQELIQQLRGASSERSRARAYAQQGFWYDALKVLSTASDAKPQDRSIAEDFYSLLNQVGLNEVVAKQRQNLQR